MLGAAEREGPLAKSMLERYGGFAILSRIVMDFYDRAIDSDTLGPYFEGIDMRRLVDHQTKFVAFLMGGPASYSDQALHQIHAPLQIDETAFEEMVTVFTETLEDHDIEPVDVQTVIDGMQSRRPVIVAERP
jgi:hemoglobin